MFLNLETIFLYFFVEKESDYICEQEEAGVIAFD
jgi:hypothetical protein